MSTIADRSLNEALKENALLLADDHRAHCPQNCGLSLVLLGRLIEQAGIKLTDEERARLM